MELGTLIISPAEAEAKLAEYERQLATERTAEDEAIRLGYRAAARGLGVIRLSEAIRLGGYFENAMPRIAVVRADAPQCFCWWDWRDLVYSCENDWRSNRGALVGDKSVRVKDPLDRPNGRSGQHYGTIVPVIPPSLRPRPRRLHGFHILWEVEQWTLQTPPVDPALIRHIRGDLWAVTATWDLTELERAVLAQRARG